MMREVITVGLAGVIALSVRLRAGEAEPGVAFLFGQDECFDDAGLPGMRVAREFSCILLTPDLRSDPRRVTGWSLAVAGSGMTITGFSVDGTAAADAAEDAYGEVTDGFQVTRLTEDCDGLPALLSVVLLSESMSATLRDRYTKVLRFTAEAEFPARDEVASVLLRYVDGCSDEETGVVENIVAWGGQGVRPHLADCRSYLRGPPSCPLPGAPLQLVFHTENVGQTEEVFKAVAPSPGPFEPAELNFPPGRARLWVGFASQLVEQGVQGWSLSIACEGDIVLADATVPETVGDPQRGIGFEKTEVVDPMRDGHPTGRTGPQGQGVISSVVLSTTDPPIALAHRGAATVLALNLEGNEGEAGLLRPKDGLYESHTPVRNVATVAGSTKPFDCHQWAIARFVSQPEEPFHRGDANDDGRLDITDALRVLGVLFLGENVLGCRDAADFDDDGHTDISDAIGSLQFLFLGMLPPAPPGPPGHPCGVDAEPHTRAGCARYDSC